MGARPVLVLVLVLLSCDSELPKCARVGGRLVDSRTVWQGEHSLVVVRSDPDLLELVEDPDCDPPEERSLSIRPAPAGAWLPPVGARLTAAFRPQEAGTSRGYVELTAPDGALVWAGGQIRRDEVGTPFRWVESDAPACQDVCVQRRPVSAWVRVDEGELPLSAEPLAVHVDAEPFVASLEASAEYGQFGPADPCRVTLDSEFWSFAAVALARTTAVDLPIVERREPPADECPAELPSDGDACTTRAELPCDYTFGGGCTRQLECVDCFWQMRTQTEPLGVDCGIDYVGCQGKGCPEESVCTHCPCGADDSRFRCVWPGEVCPPCNLP